MKKMILPALCLSLCLTSLNTSAVNTSASAISVSVSNDDRQVIKSEELPDAVKKTLASDEYKGWTVKEAAIVKAAAAPDATAAQASTEQYEVVLTNEKETKTVKFQKDGTLVK